MRVEVAGCNKFVLLLKECLFCFIHIAIEAVSVMIRMEDLKLRSESINIQCFRDGDDISLAAETILVKTFRYVSKKKNVRCPNPKYVPFFSLQLSH